MPPIRISLSRWVSRRAAALCFPIYSEVLQKFRLAAGAMVIYSRRSITATNQPVLHSAAAGTHRSRKAVDEEAYPLHALTRRPMAMYHSWGSQNAWLRQIHGHNPMFVSQALRRA